MTNSYGCGSKLKILLVYFVLRAKDDICDALLNFLFYWSLLGYWLFHLLDNCSYKLSNINLVYFVIFKYKVHKFLTFYNKKKGTSTQYLNG